MPSSSAQLVRYIAEFIAGKRICDDCLLAGKFVQIILLAGKKEKSHFWERHEKGGLAGRWKRLFFSQQVKKFNC